MVDQLTVTGYFAASGTSYWKWSAGGQEVAWADGPTIAFLPEIAVVLSRLASEGLPPFGSVLLLLAACRDNWREPPSRRGLLAGVLDAQHASSSRELLWDVCNGLDKVQGLPFDLRHPTAAKAELAALVFEGAPNRFGPVESQAIVTALNNQGIDTTAEPIVIIAQSFWDVWATDLSALRDGLRRVDEEALRLRLRTSLEAIPAPAKIEPPPLTGRAWLARLEQDQEFAGLARLAQRLLAVIHIPRHLHDADDLPVGGVTDIAPRGPLDRLLLSELANDDLTLAVRVAMNEALYFRRESPPRTPPRQRHILLDSGLRMWGLPRLYATAVALALTASHETHLEVLAHRANGPRLEPVSLHTRDGIRDHLAELDHHLHPGASLGALAELLANDEVGDAVLITSADTLADPAFQRALEQSHCSTIYLATVSRDGRFELQQCSRAGRKRLSSAHLSLEEILHQRPKAAPLRDTAKSALPAIFRADPFPLLLSTQVSLANSWHVGPLGVLTLTRDGRLLGWRGPLHRARQLAVNLPKGIIQGATLFRAPDADRYCLVVGNLSPRGLYAVWINFRGEVAPPIPLRPQGAHILSVAVDRQAAFLHSHDRLEAVDLRTGQSCGTCPLSKSMIVSGVYLRELGIDPDGMGQRGWTWKRFTTQGEGAGIKLIDVSPFQPSSDKDSCLWMFDALGMEGPVGITSEENILLPATLQLRRVDHHLPQPITVPLIARDGSRFVLRHGGRSVVVSTLTGAVSPRTSDEDVIDPSVNALVQRHPIRNRFHGIGVDEQGQLSLITPKKSSWPLSMPDLQFPPQAVPHLRFRWSSFEVWEHDEIHGFGLQRADFPDGSQAVLDSRGLLHLKSADPNIPECTIVLCEGNTAGWCSDGRMWGASYFLGDRPATRTESIAHDVIQPFLERLQ